MVVIGDGPWQGSLEAHEPLGHVRFSVEVNNP